MQSEMYTTVKIPLYVTDTTPLIQTMERFRDAYNYISEQVSYLGNDENPKAPGKYKIQKLFYQTARKQFGLKAQLSNFLMLRR